MILEPWEQVIDSYGPVYRGPADGPIRIWGRRRLLSLARLLPLAQRVDVYLLGTGLPSFWVVQMGNIAINVGAERLDGQRLDLAEVRCKCCCRPSLQAN